MTKRVLTPEERQRLRPTVDTDALERLLSRLEPGDRMLVIHACARDPDQIIVGLSQDQADAMSAPGRYGPPSRIRSLEGHLQFDTVELQQLWDAVEPPMSPGAA